MKVEVVYALPDVQYTLTVELSDGSSVADCLAHAAEDVVFARFPLGESKVGVWGEVVAHDRVLQDGDRLEIYRALEVDPMQARRARANRPTQAEGPE